MRADQTSLLESVCPACHYSLAAQFFFGEAQPLSTLGWPSSPEQAKAMPKHPLDYVQCTRCTHIWNQSFLYEAIPYSKQPNRMFNSGITWQGHLKTVRDIAMSDLPSNPTVIDIGCGEGHFVRGISEELNTEGRFIGFDPNTDYSAISNLITSQLIDGRVGSKIIEISDGHAEIKMTLEHTDDINDWSDATTSEKTFEVQVPDGTRFYRFKMTE